MKASELVALDRGLQVLRLRQEGLSFAAIGERLNISSETARHVFVREMAAHSAERSEYRQHLKDFQVSRIERFIAGIAPLAAAGDLDAMDRLLRLMDMENKLDGLYTSTVGVKGSIDHNIVHSVSQQVVEAFQAAQADRAELNSGEVVTVEAEVVEEEPASGNGSSPSG